MRAFFRELTVTAILALVIFIIINATLQTFIVIGGSMQPSFQHKDRLLVGKAAYFFSEPERGDVIIFLPPGNRNKDYIKRIIALPGDKVMVKDGVVYVNGSPLDEPYTKRPPNYTMEETEVTKDSYFVLGDNRINSTDSHSGWLVPRENIVGKAWLLIQPSLWPPGLWGAVPTYPLQEQLSNT